MAISTLNAAYLPQTFVHVVSSTYFFVKRKLRGFFGQTQQHKYSHNTQGLNHGERTTKVLLSLNLEHLLIKWSIGPVCYWKFMKKPLVTKIENFIKPILFLLFSGLLSDLHFDELSKNGFNSGNNVNGSVIYPGIGLSLNAHRWVVSTKISLQCVKNRALMAWLYTLDLACAYSASLDTEALTFYA